MDGELEYSTKGTKGQTSETLTFFPKKDFHCNQESNFICACKLALPYLTKFEIH